MSASGVMATERVAGTQVPFAAALPSAVESARPRFGFALPDPPPANRRPTDRSGEENGASQRQPPESAPAGRHPAAAGGDAALAAFVVQRLAQEEGGTAGHGAALSAYRTATGAYGRTPTAVPQAAGETGSIEILSPLPRLASGRVLDLAV